MVFGSAGRRRGGAARGGRDRRKRSLIRFFYGLSVAPDGAPPPLVASSRRV